MYPIVSTVEGITNDDIDEQPQKVNALILVNEVEEIFNFSNEEQFWKADEPMSFTEDSSDIDFNDEHPLKADVPIRSKEEGRTNSVNDEQSLKQEE